MPRYTTASGEKVPNLKIQKAWIEIPVKTDGPTAIDTETYLVQTRVADYIVMLEKKLKGKLPELPKRK